jgi:hypothetical protein
VIAVGDSTRLEIIFDTKSYSNMVSKSPRIQTNEGPPDKFVRISANVITRPDSTYPVVIKPYKLDLTQFGEKVRSEIKFTINNVSATDLQPTLVSAPEQLLEVVLPKSIPAGKSGEGLVILRKNALDKSIDKSITVQFNDEKQSRFTIPVKRQIRGTVQAAQPAAVTPQGGAH